MLDFYRHRRRFQSRRSQPEPRLLLRLVVLSVLVLWAISAAKNPAIWRALLGLPEAERPVAVAVAGPAEKPPADEPGTFRTGDASESRPSPARADRDYLPGVRGDYLSRVQDNTVFRPQEADAWFHLFDLLNRTDPAVLRRHSRGPVGYTQLQEQPAEYRGQVVTVAGRVRRAVVKQAPKNGYGIRDYYQLVLEPRGGPARPIVVYCLSLPAGFPQGDSLDAEVSLDGFYFKRWLYLSGEGEAAAPLVLAGSLAWRPSEAPSPPAGVAVPASLWWWLVPLGGVAVGALAWWLRPRAAGRRADDDDEAALARLGELSALPADDEDAP